MSIPKLESEERELEVTNLDTGHSGPRKDQLGYSRARKNMVV